METQRKNPRWENHVKVFSHAVKFVRFPTYDCRLNPNHKRVKRGNINSFSRHSRLRLREAIAKSRLENCQGIFGVCLTVPWVDDSISFDNYLVEYRECFHRFTIYFRRCFSLSACIFRHELQTRKMPHCHLILYLSKLDCISNNDLESTIKSLWVRSLQGSYHKGNSVSFLRFGCKVDPLDNLPSLFRYISDHTSKSKQAQLGYIGKQWGYINKQVFASEKPFIFSFTSESQKIFFQRHIKKLSYFTSSYHSLRKKNKWSPKHFTKSGKAARFTKFGYKKIRNNSCAGLRFIESKIVNQICHYINRNDII